MNLKTVLITLSIIAGVLIVITFYVVFYSGGGTYVVSSTLGPNAGIFSTSTSAESSSTASGVGASSTLALASGTASSSEGTGGELSTQGNGGTAVTWTQGNETMSIANAVITGTQLTLGVQVTMGSVGECVPLNLRLIADEQGDLSPPVTSQFTFPDTGTCNGTPGETYSAQPIVFTLSNPGTFPIILTTGGAANLLFEVDQNSDGSLSVQLPPNAG
jgi:hypothetical protein